MCSHFCYKCGCTMSMTWMKSIHVNTVKSRESNQLACLQIPKKTWKLFWPLVGPKGCTKFGTLMSKTRHVLSGVMGAEAWRQIVVTQNHKTCHGFKTSSKLKVLKPHVHLLADLKSRYSFWYKIVKIKMFSIGFCRPIKFYQIILKSLVNCCLKPSIFWQNLQITNKLSGCPHKITIGLCS